MRCKSWYWSRNGVAAIKYCCQRFRISDHCKNSCKTWRVKKWNQVQVYRIFQSLFNALNTYQLLPFQSIYLFKNLCSAEGIDVHVLACDAEKLNSDKILELQGAISSLIGFNFNFIRFFIHLFLFILSDLNCKKFCFILLKIFAVKSEKKFSNFTRALLLQIIYAQII